MFVAVILLLSLIIIAADWLAYRRYLGPCDAVWVRRVGALLLVAANLLPYLAVAMMWMEWVSGVVPTMWVLTIYTILSLSRLALYCGILIIQHRRAKWIVGGVLCVVTTFALLVAVVHTRKDITVRSVEVASERLPQSFDGYRIALFSDLHLGSMTSPRKMCHDVVDTINSLDVDLVVFAGDLVNAAYDELTPDVAEVLGGIRARDGVVAVLGNHDTGVYVRDTVALPIEENTRRLKARIADMGWRVVDDKTEFIVRACDSISVTGVGFSRELLEYRHSADVADMFDVRPIFEGVPRDKFNIAVSHMPQLWRKIAAIGCGDLVLSGHIHAMQVKATVVGCSVSPAQFMYDEWSGLYREQGSHLYITDGVGSVGFHLRLGAPPEVAHITLKRESR